MKNSKQYSKKVQKLYQTLKRKYPKPQKVTYDKSVEAIVYATVSEHITVKEAEAAMKKFRESFIDFNDLRVSLTEEVLEAIGPDTVVTRSTATTISDALRAVFNKYNMVSLEPLRKIGKRPAKEILENMEGVSQFAVNYCMLTSLQGHAIPLTEKMIEYLRAEELVYPSATDHEIEGFLVKQISANNAYGFYSLLRYESEHTKIKKKVKKKTEAKASKKTSKEVKKTKTKVKKKTKKVTKAKKTTKVTKTKKTKKAKKKG